MNKPKSLTTPQLTVGFVCTHAYPILDDKIAPDANFGGMETRAVTIAKGLARNKDITVKFYVANLGQQDNKLIDGISFYIYQKLWSKAVAIIKKSLQRSIKPDKYYLRLCNVHLLWAAPVAILYKLFPNLLFPLFWRANRCDIVCCFGVNAITANTIKHCSSINIPTIIFIASDSDLSDEYHKQATGHNQNSCPKQLCYYALTNATHIVVQTQTQYFLLKNRFNRYADIIHNPISMKPVTPHIEIQQYVLWVGRTDIFHKLPHLCIKIAKRLPHLKFLMILNNTNAQIFKSIQDDKPHNVEIIDKVPFSQMSSYFSKAMLLLSTSSRYFEGFPNTFLQAGSHGIPIATLEVDPDNVFALCGGAVNAHGDIDVLIEHVRRLSENRAIRQEMAIKIMGYVNQFHDLDNVVVKVHNIIRTTITRQL